MFRRQGDLDEDHDVDHGLCKVAYDEELDERRAELLRRVKARAHAGGPKLLNPWAPTAVAGGATLPAGEEGRGEGDSQEAADAEPGAENPRALEQLLQDLRRPNAGGGEAQPSELPGPTQMDPHDPTHMGPLGAAPQHQPSATGPPQPQPGRAGAPGQGFPGFPYVAPGRGRGGAGRGAGGRGGGRLAWGLQASPPKKKARFVIKEPPPLGPPGGGVGAYELALLAAGPGAGHRSAPGGEAPLEGPGAAAAQAQAIDGAGSKTPVPSQAGPVSSLAALLAAGPPPSALKAQTPAGRTLGRLPLSHGLNSAATPGPGPTSCVGARPTSSFMPPPASTPARGGAAAGGRPSLCALALTPVPAALGGGASAAGGGGGPPRGPAGQPPHSAPSARPAPSALPFATPQPRPVSTPYGGPPPPPSAARPGTAPASMRDLLRPAPSPAPARSSAASHSAGGPGPPAGTSGASPSQQPGGGGPAPSSLELLGHQSSRQKEFLAGLGPPGPAASLLGSAKRGGGRAAAGLQGRLQAVLAALKLAGEREADALVTVPPPPIPGGSVQVEVRSRTREGHLTRACGRVIKLYGAAPRPAAAAAASALPGGAAGEASTADGPGPPAAAAPEAPALDVGAAVAVLLDSKRWDWGIEEGSRLLVLPPYKLLEVPYRSYRPPAQAQGQEGEAGVAAAGAGGGGGTQAAGGRQGLAGAVGGGLGAITRPEAGPGRGSGVDAGPRVWVLLAHVVRRVDTAGGR
ncbi:hypothetical protein HYH03_013010 [Edaphochlamys debaryana]|uniref:Uncharacterized protein n=1 Tax=Edaphochlamys debaryana TaxID=47281 RepID=A0A835XP48_9CHLO|nr:hypothetical protein HYH03_013010 [Edaphochlamys debaryana]|eukprot:KAG2488507.1 hypothetical protein HYH03_013010 [Edaphochlamys debaryana]